MKLAIVYDKWLAGLGGGEVVACTMARTLKDVGYDVLFLSKDLVSPQKIKEKLGIDLNDITFKQVSNEHDLPTSPTLRQRLRSGKARLRGAGQSPVSN